MSIVFGLTSCKVGLLKLNDGFVLVSVVSKTNPYNDGLGGLVLMVQAV
jgi:hypothetical protein